MSSNVVADINCYDKNGKKVPVLMIGVKGKYFECPICKHHWKIRKTDGIIGIVRFLLIMVIISVFFICRNIL